MAGGHGAHNIEAGGAFVRLFLKDDLTKAMHKGLSVIAYKLKDMGHSLNMFGMNAAMAGKSMMMLGAAGVAPLGKSLMVFAKFDDQMRAVAGVTGATGGEFQAMTDEAKRLGATTSYTASEIAGLMVELGRAGFKPQEILDSTEAIQNLARATSTDLAKAAEIAGNAIRQFNLPVSDSSRVADVLTATALSSSQTVTDLGEAFSYVGPVATDAGMSIEDTAKALGVLANLGLKGSMGGTGLRRAVLAFADPAIQKKLVALGVHATDAAGNLRPIADIMLDVGKATAKMPNAERLAFMREVFDLRGMTAGMKLSSSVEQMQAMSDAIDAAGGRAKATADMMDSGLGGSFRIMLSAVEGLAIQMGEVLSPIFMNLAKIIELVANEGIEWAKANKGILLVAISVSAALLAGGAAMMGLGAAATVAGFAISSIATVLGVLAGLLPLLVPLGGIILGVTAALSALYLMDHAGTIDFGPVLQSMKDLGAYLGGEFMTLWGTLKTAAIDAWGGISAAIQQGDLQSAGEIAMAGLEVAVAAGLLAMRTMWEDYRQAVLETLSGTYLLAIDMMEKLSGLGGAFTKMLAGGMAGKARDIVGGALAGADARGQERIGSARQDVADAEQRLREKAQKPNEFVEDFREDFIEDIPQKASGAATARDFDAEIAAAKEKADSISFKMNEMSPLDAGFAELGKAFTAADAEWKKLNQDKAAAEQADVESALQDWFNQRDLEDSAGGYLPDMADVPDFTQEPEPVEISESQRAQIFDGSPAVPRGVGTNLTTYNAAAAQAAGFMGGGTPEERSAKASETMAAKMDEQIKLMAEGNAKADDVIATYERFLAAMSYG